MASRTALRKVSFVMSRDDMPTLTIKWAVRARCNMRAVHSGGRKRMFIQRREHWTATSRQALHTWLTRRQAGDEELVYSISRKRMKISERRESGRREMGR